MTNPFSENPYESPQIRADVVQPPRKQEPVTPHFWLITFLRNIAAFILGFIVCGAVNMALITISPQVIPPPAGVDVTKAESLAENIHLFKPQHFLFPFLAHALGSLAGALVAYLVAGSYRAVFAYVIGALHLAGGIAAAFMIPAPLWFIVLDLVVAYLPMAWVATLIGSRITGTAAGSTAKN
jgi:hypothetical protein